jgi:tetrahydrodipicolinate N-succinyltransferase
MKSITKITKVDKGLFKVISFKDFAKEKPSPMKFSKTTSQQEKISTLIKYEASTDERKLHVLREDRLWKILNESSNRALYSSKEKRNTILKAEQYLLNRGYRVVIIHTIDGEPKDCILRKEVKISELFSVK